MSTLDPAAIERALWVDAAAVKAIGDLRAAGVEPILLKGRGFARELYASGGQRTYGDCDLLVPVGRHAAAEAALAARGYTPLRPAFDAALPAHQQHARDWGIPGHRVALELHWTVIGAGAPPARVWEGLAGHTRPIALGPLEVLAPTGPAAAWHVAVHAAQHGPGHAPCARDLARALARYDEATWRAAAALARELDAEPAFALGLRLDPEGAALADRLGLRAGGSVAVELLGTGAPGGALGLETLATTSGLGARARLVGRTLAPAPGTMRVQKPLARRGRRGLVAAYAVRPLDLMRQFPAAWRAWRRARRRG